MRLAVQNIENRALLAQHRQHRLLRFHPHREFIATAGEGILAIDAGGAISSANVAALEWLGIPDHGSLCGQSVRSVFGLDLSRLEALREALERCDWNVTRAATQLGISRRTLHRKLNTHRLRRYRSWDGGSDGG